MKLIYNCKSCSKYSRYRKKAQISYRIFRAPEVLLCKQTREAVKNEKDNLLAVINATTDKIFLIDTKGVILAINKAAAQYLGLEQDNAVGVNVFDIVSPEAAQKRKAIIRKICATQQPFRVESRKLNGWLDTSFFPVVVNGKVVRIVVYGRDITGRKVAEEALKANEERYRSIFENAMEGIFQSNRCGRFIRVNPAFAAIYGYDSPEEMLMTVTDIPHQLFANHDEREEHRKLLEANGMVRNFEHEAIRKDGSKIWVSINTRIVRGASGKALYYEGTVVADITSRKKAEAALNAEWEKSRAALENARAIVNATMDTIYLFNTDGVILAINEAGAVRLGIEFSKAIGANVYENVPSEVEQRRRSRVAKVVHTKKPVYYDADLRGRWYDTCLYPVITNGDVTGIVLYGRDITERKQTEEALRKSEEKYRDIFENAMEGIFQKTLNGNFISINPAMAYMYGYDSPEEMISSITDTARQLYVNPGECEIYRNQLRKCGVIKNMEHQMYRKDGSKIWVSRSARLVSGDKGNIIYYEGTITDITRRKLAEEELMKEREKFRIILDYTPLGMAMIGKDNIFRYINPRFRVLFGYDLEDIPDGRTWFRKAFPDPDYRHEVIATWLSLIKDHQGKKPREIPKEFNTTCKDGSTKDVNFLAVTLETGEHIMACEDITERKRAEEELKKYYEHLEELVENRTLELKAANKELEAFSYSVSHDLRTPLRAIDGFSRILAEEHAASLSQEAQRYIGLVRTGARQMGKLIDDLLTFSRLSRQPLAMQSIAPASIVRQVLEQLHDMREGRRIEISIGDLPVCQSDPSLLKVLYTNLLSNALKFTKKRDYTIIEVGFQDENEEHVYYVKDNGVGFNMKYIDKLFGVFQRLHRADEYEGTGVGLANVQRIVHRHGGRIWVASEVDKGTTFYFTLERGGKLL